MASRGLPSHRFVHVKPFSSKKKKKKKKKKRCSERKDGTVEASATQVITRKGPARDQDKDKEKRCKQKRKGDKRNRIQAEETDH